MNTCSLHTRDNIDVEHTKKLKAENNSWVAAAFVQKATATQSCKTAHLDKKKAYQINTNLVTIMVTTTLIIIIIINIRIN